MADEARITHIGRYTAYKESAPTARITQIARYVLYPFTCVDNPEEPEPEPEVESCPEIFLDETPLNALDRLFSVHGDKIYGDSAAAPVCLDTDDDPTLTPLERFFRVHGYDQPRTKPAETVSIIGVEFEGYNGVLGEMPPGEFVLGGYGVVSNSVSSASDACLDFETPSQPVQGVHR